MALGSYLTFWSFSVLMCRLGIITCCCLLAFALPFPLPGCSCQSSAWLTPLPHSGPCLHATSSESLPDPVTKPCSNSFTELIMTSHCHTGTVGCLPHVLPKVQAQRGWDTSSLLTAEVPAPKMAPRTQFTLNEHC